MRKFLTASLLGLFLLIPSTSSPKVFADMTALEGYGLSTSQTFLHRLSILLDAEAMVVLRESTGTTNHTNRVTLAKNILFAVDVYSATLARQLVFDTNLIAAGFTTDGDGNPKDSSATDSAIRSQIATNWNAWTGN